MKVEFIFKIEPVSKGRPKFSTHSGFARAYTPSKTRRFEAELAALARLAMIEHKYEKIDYAIAIELRVFISRPKSVSEKSRPHPTSRPDLDNYIKCLDALNDIIWTDDSLICSITASKSYSAGKGFIVLNIKPM